MLWYRYRKVPGRHYRLPLADSKGAHGSKELRYAYGKDGPQCRRYGFSGVEQSDSIRFFCSQPPI